MLGSDWHKGLNASQRQVLLGAGGAFLIVYGYGVVARFPPLVGALVLLVPLLFASSSFVYVGAYDRMTQLKRQLLALAGVALMLVYGRVFLGYFPPPLGALAFLAQVPPTIAYLGMALAWKRKV